ncbi:MAG: prepilin peptidase [Enterocloster asparagiformis]|nr:prepilin peptidase [Enterocloster asparagiformis]
MPDNPAALLTEATAAFTPVLVPVQAGLFLSLLFVVSVCDIRSREIPDSLQLAIAALVLLRFTPGDLFGVLGALPYLAVALFFDGIHGIGGGDIKLAAATGLVLGLAASLTASVLGLAVFLAYAATCSCIRRLHGRKGKYAFPVGPFLAVGSATAYFMKIGGLIL